MNQLITDNVDLTNEIVFKQWVKDLQNVLNIEQPKQPDLLNSWANDTGRTTKYYKYLGRVYIEGELISGSGVAFTLPSNYAPDEILTFTNVTIDVNGDVTPSVATSLDGISFKV